MSTAQKIFRHTVRVPYAHTDQMRYVYYANYLVYFEMARSEMLRETGIPYSVLEAQGIYLPVIEAHCVYKAPAHFDDLLEIASVCAIEGARLKINYTVTRLENGCGNTPAPELLVTGYTVHVCLNNQGRPMRPPAALQKLTA